MIKQVEFTLKPRTRGFHLITQEVMSHLPELPEAGLLHLFIKHTSCAYNNLVKENQAYYTHVDEGPDDMPSHAKCSLTGVSLTIPVTSGRLNLGTWQGIYLCEFRDYGGARRIVASILG